MREITEHQVNECNRAITIQARDAMETGAPREYFITLGANHFVLTFQHGPIADGINGITHEVLLAILIDRLRGFQSGPFVDEHNTAALACLEAARGNLLERTRVREARGIEGTHTP